MAKVTEISEHFQHFLAEMKESFWGDLYGQTKLAWQRFFELQSEPQRDRYAVRAVYQRRRNRQQPYRNGYYERDFVTRFGTIRLRIARTRGKSFLPVGLRRLSSSTASSRFRLSSVDLSKMSDGPCDIETLF
jgi:mutator family transposase